jgi:hypothetical protein
MTELYNEDGMALQDMEVVYDVLEQVREHLDEADRTDESDILMKAQIIVQNYDEASDWSEPTDE